MQLSWSTLAAFEPRVKLARYFKVWDKTSGRRYGCITNVFPDNWIKNKRVIKNGKALFPGSVHSQITAAFVCDSTKR